MAKTVRACSKTASVLYLFKKVLAVVVALLLVIVVSQHALSELDRIDKDLNSISGDSPNGGRPSSADVQPSQDLSKLPLEIFLCGFKIRQLQSVQTWTVQCAIEYSNIKHNSKDVTSRIKTMPKSQPWTNERNLVAFESLLLKMVIAFLSVLTIGNVFSLATWACKLLNNGSITALGLTSNTATDIVLLVQMAKLNAGADIARRLAQSSSGDSGKVQEEIMSMDEPKST